MPTVTQTITFSFTGPDGRVSAKNFDVSTIDAASLTSDPTPLYDLIRVGSDDLVRLEVTITRLLEQAALTLVEEHSDLTLLPLLLGSSRLGRFDVVLPFSELGRQRFENPQTFIGRSRHVLKKKVR